MQTYLNTSDNGDISDNAITKITNQNKKVIIMSSESDKTQIDDSTLRMRKRFQEIDETRRIQKEVKAGWIWIFFMGFAILVIGFFGVLVAANAVKLSTELLIAVGLILVGFFFIFTAVFVRDTADMYVGDHYSKK